MTSKITKKEDGNKNKTGGSWLTLGLCFFAVCATGFAIGAADPLQEMMYLNNSFANIENEEDRVTIATAITSFGQSCCMLSGVLIGPFIALVGMKIAALVGVVMHVFAYILMFGTTIPLVSYVGSGLFGFGFQCIVNTHLNVAALFPQSPQLVLAIIGSAPDVSLFIPPTLLSLARQYSVFRVVMVYLLVAVLPCFLIDLFIIPSDGFQLAPELEDSQDTENPESLPLINAEVASEVESTSLKEVAVQRHENKTIFRQLLTVEFWIYVPFFMACLLRKKHFSVYIRSIFRELDSDPSKATADLYAGIYSAIVPFGFITSVLWGGLVDHVGIHPLLIVSNLFFVATFGLSLIRNMQTQLVTIAVFIVTQSFVIGQMIAFLSSTYGLKTLAGLQGVIATLTGVVSLVMDFQWGFFITQVVGSYHRVNFFIFVGSIVITILPVILAAIYYVTSGARRRNKSLSNAFIPEANDQTRTLPVQCYERTSLSLLQRRSGSSKSQ